MESKFVYEGEATDEEETPDGGDAPADDNGETPPADDDGETTPADGDGETTPSDGDDEGAPAEDGGDTSSEDEGEEPAEEEDPIPLFFTDQLKPDEELWVIMTAAINFYKKVQSQYDGMTSYTTDAMAVTHGDAPFKNLQDKITAEKGERDVVWWRMIRYNLL